MLRPPLISIIVPVYNVEDFLQDTVESLINQTYRSLEIILVDDGSTDKSDLIADSLAARDNRITVIHKENGGLGSARNAGIDKASGEWIVFVDADDLLHPEFCSILLEGAISNKAQIAASGFINSSEPGNFIHTKTSPLRFSSFTSEEGVELSLYQRIINNSVCMKIFSSSLFGKERFNEKILYEDLDIFYRIVLRADKVAVTDLPLYFYRKRKGSIINTFNPGRLDVLDVTDRICSFMKEFYPSILPAARSRKISANFNMLAMMMKAGGYEKEKKRCWNNIRELRSEVIADSKARPLSRIAACLSYSGFRFTSFILGKLK